MANFILCEVVGIQFSESRMVQMLVRKISHKPVYLSGFLGLKTHQTRLIQFLF